MTNAHKEQMRVPSSKATLFLTYISGEAVDDWVQEKMDWLENHSFMDDDTQPWDTIRTKFEQAFTYTGEKSNAIFQLQKLTMDKGDIDEYNAKFNHLLKEAGYGKDELATVAMYKQGLVGGLLKALILHPTKKLVTLNNWQEEARNKQRTFLEAEHMGGRPFNAKKQAIMQKLRNPQRNFRGNKPRHPDAIDVDSIHTYPDGR